MDSEFREDLAGTISNLNGTTESLKNILSSKEKELKATLDNVNKFTKMLSDNSASMSKTFSNLEAITDTLAAADIYKSVS